MAELTITAANVKASSNTDFRLVQYGEAVDQGEAVYANTDGKYLLADNSDTTKANVAGIALTPNVLDGYGIIAISGKIDLGATLAVGQVYCLASTPGKIELESDVASSEIVTILGSGAATDEFDMGIQATGIAHA